MATIIIMSACVVRLPPQLLPVLALLLHNRPCWGALERACALRNINRLQLAPSASGQTSLEWRLLKFLVLSGPKSPYPTPMAPLTTRLLSFSFPLTRILIRFCTEKLNSIKHSGASGPNDVMMTWRKTVTHHSNLSLVVAQFEGLPFPEASSKATCSNSWFNFSEARRRRRPQRFATYSSFTLQSA